jgi:hypothetical protein
MSGLSNPSIFGLQPTLLSIRIFSVKIIEKVENVGRYAAPRVQNGEEERCESYFVTVCATVTGALVEQTTTSSSGRFSPT